MCSESEITSSYPETTASDENSMTDDMDDIKSESNGGYEGYSPSARSLSTLDESALGEEEEHIAVSEGDESSAGSGNSNFSACSTICSFSTTESFDVVSSASSSDAPSSTDVEDTITVTNRGASPILGSGLGEGIEVDRDMRGGKAYDLRSSIRRNRPNYTDPPGSLPSSSYSISDSSSSNYSYSSDTQRPTLTNTTASRLLARINAKISKTEKNMKNLHRQSIQLKHPLNKALSDIRQKELSSEYKELKKMGRDFSDAQEEIIKMKGINKEEKRKWLEDLEGMVAKKVKF